MKRPFALLVVFAMFLPVRIFAAGIVTDRIGMTHDEVMAISKVRRLSKYHVERGQDCFNLYFTLTDDAGGVTAVPFYADISIVNDNGESVYGVTKTIGSDDFREYSFPDYGKLTLVEINIPDSDIKPSSCEEGVLYLTVYNPGYIEFNKLALDIGDKLSGGLPFKANYARPIEVDPFVFAKNCENMAKRKELYSGKAVQMTVKVGLIGGTYGGNNRYIVANDYRLGKNGEESYSIMMNMDEPMQRFSKIRQGMVMTVRGFVDFSSGVCELVHAVIV